MEYRRAANLQVLRTHLMRLSRRRGGAARRAHCILLKYRVGCRKAEARRPRPLSRRYDRSGAPGGSAMTTTVKATYANGVFTPQEPVDLEEGAEVMVSMDGTPRESSGRGEEGGASLLDLIEELHTSALVGEPDDRPADLAEHYKHYLYGHPKDDAP
ncbi:MAG: DUF104 domain-containing protein [Dehalococcoidia bacterium]|nr:DUF104 domain-containing protein [Dehalococcoidia bacterium]MYA52121.1 DUF104 domain-containing protein [Dehalococcoidia bacterium]